jgi:hypothetical protein
MAADLKVLLVLPQDRAIVSTTGFCRVISKQNGDIYEDMVPLAEAHFLSAQHDDEFALEAIDYATNELIQFDNRGLSESRRRRLQQLMDAPRDTKSRHNRGLFCLGRVVSS